MSAIMVLRISCDFCDTALSIRVREAVEVSEVLQQVTQHGWTEKADGKLLRHLCPCCVEVLDDAPPPSEDIPW